MVKAGGNLELSTMFANFLVNLVSANGCFLAPTIKLLVHNFLVRSCNRQCHFTVNIKRCLFCEVQPAAMDDRAN